ncbi:MAG: hypothetical protein UR27_C0003G0057 [Candidatus Peregrinibacteria bacterium GW2011_GWA2_33_10]|nr:MAG: hypothetical protein UR27_C0003G0057 [Candidatus Peregrinibacteria bacterium GW2011_GWA2_33_10]KKP40783.1 MAG: hypothetical protein UR30_C0004G0041 [Candidatus Peregrinibacteria bacterium GW2011_GWC2_33_13]OGJ50946.1 MAG: hypothetical protein A2229_03090 [Candidatus Peregrinibacteria bacterium RIFOXYA2_FULL_33_7]
MQLVIPKSSGYPGIRKRTLSQQVKIGTFSLIIMIVLLCASMAVLFLLRFNSISTKGYVLRKLESERLQLVKEIERKEMEISNVRTLEFILNSEKVKRMVQLNQDRIVYLNKDDGLAKK